MAHVILKDLVKTYGSFFAVNNVSLTVNDGSSTDVAFDITGGGAIFQLGYQPQLLTEPEAIAHHVLGRHPARRGVGPVAGRAAVASLTP